MIKELREEDLFLPCIYEDIENENEITEEERRFYEDIYKGVAIDKNGFNIFIVDDNKSLNIEELIKGINKNVKFKNKKDIFFANNDKKIDSLYMSLGFGETFYKLVEIIKDKYKNIIIEFYNRDISEEKKEELSKINNIRNDKIDELVVKAERLSFKLKVSDKGFSFNPIKNEKVISEGDFNYLKGEEKERIYEDLNYIKEESRLTLEFIEEREKESIEKLKKIFEKYLSRENENIEEEISNKCSKEKQAFDYLMNMIICICSKATQIFTLDFQEDFDFMEKYINSFIVFQINKKENSKKTVIYEDRPFFSNIFGKIEYENVDSGYTTSIKNFLPGSLIRADGGVLIINLDELLNYRGVYYYLQKSILNNRVSNDFSLFVNENYPIKGLKLPDINIFVKLILIGDYSNFLLLKNLDKDFNKIFGSICFLDGDILISSYNVNAIKNKIKNIINKNKLLEIKKDAIEEIIWFFSKEAGNINKIRYSYVTLEKILIKASSNGILNNRENITKEDILESIYNRDIYEEEINEEYKEKKILYNLNGELVGEVNGLTVIDTGIKTIGKPVKIICNIAPGNGEIFDIQKESELSGKIHTKAIGILKGYINSLPEFGDKLNYDFYLSFEQIYSQLDGDSASVAEIISIISSITKLGVKQNIGVTGSMNQRGIIQPVGGITEKIEGFYNLCKSVDTVVGKGILMPYSNINSLVLNEDILEDIKNGVFKIYTMETLEDAAIVLLGVKSFEDILSIIRRESKRKKSR